MTMPRVQSAAGSVVSGIGLVAAIVLGSVWTGMAVADGSMLATAVRFVVAIGAGLFYLILLRAARRPVG